MNTSSMDDQNLHSSQLSLFSSYLSQIPCGSLSSGKVKKIRLLKKSSFLNLPKIQLFIQSLLKILSEVDLEVKSHGYGSYSSYYCWFTFSQEARDICEKIVSESEKTRTEFEKLLFWRDQSSDQLCELFDLDSAPKFTFISHRWAPEGRALGLHNELVLILSLAPEDYVWLDCLCAPQDQKSFETGNCLKVIWNIQHLLEKATNVLDYYAVDGLNIRVANERPRYATFDDLVETHIPSHGLQRLLHCLTNEDEKVFCEKLGDQNAIGSCRLWCLFEKKLGKEKWTQGDAKQLYQIENLKIPELNIKEPKTDVSPINPPKNEEEEEEEEEDYDYGDDRRSDVAAIEDSQVIDNINECSLSCYSETDLEPVTTMMFEAKKFPSVFTKDLIFIPTEEGKKIPAFVLPELILDGEDTDKWYKYRKMNPKVKDFYGWYGNDAMHKHVGIDYTFNFSLEVPQNSLHKRIQLQVHLKCLISFQKNRSPKETRNVWVFYRSLSKKSAGFFDRERDTACAYRPCVEKCVLCDDTEPDMMTKMEEECLLL